MKRTLPPRDVTPAGDGGTSGSRTRSEQVKATEGVKHLDTAPKNPPGYGRRYAGTDHDETGEALPGSGAVRPQADRIRAELEIGTRREGVRWGHSTVDGRTSTNRPEGRTPASSTHPEEGGTRACRKANHPADSGNGGGDKVRALQRVLYRAAKARPTRRFHALYDRLCRDDVLERAWELVRENGGSAGTDGVRIEDVERAGPEEVLKKLATELRSGQYRPHPVRRVFIPKPQGGERPLGIPTVRDRIVQAAAKLVLEPIFEADFVSVSYGFRPRKSAIEACEAIRLAMNRGEVYVLDLDIRKYFDSIRHRELLDLFGRRVSDRRVRRLVRLWLEAGVLENGVMSETTVGTPQGGVVSPLLANIFLHWLDTIWVTRCTHLGTLVRYADDMVVLCRSKAAVEEAKRRIEWVFSRLGLEMHPEKTRIVCVAKGDEGFDFLGFHHRKVLSWRWKGKLYGQRWPSKKAMTRIRERITTLTAPRTATLPVEELINRLNAVLRGWWGYFRWGCSNRQADKLHRHIHERLSRHMARRHQRVGHQWRKYDSAWLQCIGVYRLTGTRYGAPPHRDHRRPPVKGVGEPDEGEPHVRNR